jgi:hypothetical protein
MTNSQRLAEYDRLLGECMPPDFRDWWQNSPDEWPAVAAAVIRGLRLEVDTLEAHFGRLLAKLDRLSGTAQ